ncbi:Sensor histidine kinase DesK [Actinomadura rubteroloni]|uniref:histidine kinase n=1 Tax=Actinomadura rubteroloni TaxID=1926885 RepID=A0A2P4UR03_9ACTN|nr:Sensor histidine kinase DesK [Actinomadura rubteroloni]
MLGVTSSSALRRVPPPSEWPVWVVPAVLLAVQIAGSFGAQHPDGRWSGHEDRLPPAMQLDALGVALLAAGPLALLLRRRAPVAVLAATGAVTAFYLLRAYTYGPVILSPLVAMVAAVTAGRRLVAWTGTAATITGYLVLTTLIGVPGAERGRTGAFFPVDRPGLDGVAGSLGWALVALVTGELLRATSLRAAAAARTRAEEDRRRASEERLRMARELHDVLAHNISMINVRAGVALHLLDENPDEARSALAAIKEASKEALTEMRSVIGALRAEGERAPRSPTAGLAQLDDLVDRARAAGLDVLLTVTGDRRSLPAGADLAAFRIVQESLTNITRHAGPPPVTADITLAYTPDTLTLTITNTSAPSRAPVQPGTDPPRSTTSGVHGGAASGGEGDAESGVAAGSGLRGMRERVTALNGTFTAGPEPGGGFTVHAEIPC